MPDIGINLHCIYTCLWSYSRSLRYENNHIILSASLLQAVIIKVRVSLCLLPEGKINIKVVQKNWDRVDKTLDLGLQFLLTSLLSSRESFWWPFTQISINSHFLSKATHFLFEIYPCHNAAGHNNPLRREKQI